MLTFSGTPDFLDHYSVGGFRVSHVLGEPGMLVLDLRARRDSTRPEFVDHTELQKALGTKIECQFGGWSFAGVIEGVAFDGARGDFRLTARDALAELDRIYASNVFAQTTLEDIMSELIPRGQSFQFIGKLGQIKIPLAIQYQESGLQFMKRVVHQCGGQVWCYGGEIYVGNQPSSKSIDLQIGREILRYSFRTQLGLESVEGNSVAYADKNACQAQSIKLSGGSCGKLQDSAIDLRGKAGKKASFHIVHEDGSSADVKSYGEGVLRSQASGRFILVGTLRDAVPLGARLSISNYDKSGGGTHVKESAFVHAISGVSERSGEGAVWELEARNPDALLDAPDLPPNRLLTSTAIVRGTQDAASRAKVYFPWDKKQVETPWLRVVTPSWGAKHFHYVPPKEGDTVLVVWGQWDMDPVIIGAVAAGEEVGSSSDAFVFQTVEGHTISIDGKVIRVSNEANGGGTHVEIASNKITVDTPDGHKVEIAPGGLSLKHSAGGTVEIQSSKITIRSAGDVEILGGQGASIKLSGPQVSINNGALDIM